MSEGEVLRVAFGMAVRCASAEGVTKAAGGDYSRRVAVWADVFLPVAEEMCRVADRLDERGAGIGALVAAAEDRKEMAAKSFGMSVRGAQEPHQTVPLDPESMRLHATLGPPAAGPEINGYGAVAPDGGQLWLRLIAPGAGRS